MKSSRATTARARHLRELPCRQNSSPAASSKNAWPPAPASSAAPSTPTIAGMAKWKKSRELLLLIKTTTRRLGALEREVKRLHSYDVPEFIALPIVAGSKAYLDWLDENT